MADDDATVVEVAEITPDIFDGEQETPKAESTPAEPEAKAEEVKEEPEVAKEEAKAEPEETETETPEETPKEEETETQPQGKAEERKSQLNTEIRDLVAQRNALKEEVAKANAEVYQPATEDELVEEGLSATDAKVEALRQQIEVKDYNERVAEAQLTIGHESMRVLQDFPIFNAESEEYDKELAEEAAELLEANLVRDPNTQQVIGSNVSPYRLYKTIARASGLSQVKGQIKGQQDTEKMLANADAGGSAAPPKTKTDPLTELWNEPL
jgi:hypothetical protein